jgi:hypothetical protein
MSQVDVCDEENFKSDIDELEGGVRLKHDAPSCNVNRKSGTIKLSEGSDNNQGPNPDKSTISAEMTTHLESPRQNLNSRTNELDVYGSGPTNLTRLVKEWEAFVYDGARNAHLGLETLTRCVGHVASDDDGDPFAPFKLRHAHSSPNYSSFSTLQPASASIFYRPSSTPSTTSFSQRSASSAFAKVRTLPTLSALDDRSAFSVLPLRPSTAASSDPGSRYNSLFQSSDFSNDIQETEKASIEIVDLGPALFESKPAPQKWYASLKAKSFLKGNVLLRQRRRWGDRVDSSKMPPTALTTKVTGRNVESDDGNSWRRGVQVIETVQSSEEEEIYRIRAREVKFSSRREDEEDVLAVSPQSFSRYQGVDSDIEDDDTHFHRIVEIHDFPDSIPSPEYQQLTDSGGRFQSEATTTTLRHTPPIGSISNSLNGISLTLSQDSGAESPGTAMSTLTSNTSGHITLGTSTSATLSSGRITILSTVSETDREVMETNRAARGLRLQRVAQADLKIDGESDATVHSSSTASTKTVGYLTLGSPGPLRDGASLMTDRFFKQSTIPVNQLASTTPSNGALESAQNRTNSHSSTETHEPSSDEYPINVFGTNVNNALTSTHLEETSEFVTYSESPISLFKDDIKSMIRGSLFGTSSQEMLHNTESIASIRDHTSQVIFEEAKPNSQSLFRPLKVRDHKNSVSKPPLSPVKGLKAPLSRYPVPSSGSDIAEEQEQSPPNIIDHRIQYSNVSKPHVLRSPIASKTGAVVITPERLDSDMLMERDKQSVEIEKFSPDTMIGNSQIHRSRTYRETSIEVEDVLVVEPDSLAPLVTPEKP